MIYEIESKNDLSGAMLVIRFPLEELDKKALYTIENDQPPFLVPFSFRSVDGMAECTYRPGSRSKLQYRFGSRAPADYAAFWEQVLQPLLDCGDWFLKPFSFVLDARWLYAGKDGAVSYLYVPSLRDCEDFDALRGMAMELSQRNSVTDPALENRVLRALMQDFQPRSFLSMLRSAVGAAASAPAHAPVSVPAPAGQAAPVPAAEPVSAPVPAPAAQAALETDYHLPERLMPREPEAVPAAPAADDGEIHINLGGGKRPKPAKEKPVKEHKPLFGGKKEKPAKPVKEKPVKEHKPLFGGKKAPSQAVLLGAAEPQPIRAAQPIPQPAVQPIRTAQPALSYESEIPDGATQLDDAPSGGAACLRLVGDPGMPREIAVDIQPGRAFTIGRFDVTVGQKQSDFEFPRDTKAVSRRHAAIEREETGYFAVDLGSSAGTFVDGRRLTPNVPHPLTDGCRVAFGTGGADYVWSE